MEPSTQKGYSMASWRTFIFKSVVQYLVTYASDFTFFGKPCKDTDQEKECVCVCIYPSIHLFFLCNVAASLLTFMHLTDTFVI